MMFLSVALSTQRYKIAFLVRTATGNMSLVMNVQVDSLAASLATILVSSQYLSAKSLVFCVSPIPFLMFEHCSVLRYLPSM